MLYRTYDACFVLLQARCYEAAINYWRRLRSQPAGKSALTLAGSLLTTRILMIRGK
jgi:hypothetical protein